MTFPKYSFFSEKGYKLTKSYTTARTFLGLGKYASYKDFGEESWKIGYGSKELHGHALTSKDKATQEEIDKQLAIITCARDKIKTIEDDYSNNDDDIPF